MNLQAIDWVIVVAVVALMVTGVVASRKQMRGVADFLAAGRTAGRYVLSLSQGVAALGAISIVGQFEMNYVAGFSMMWWNLSTAFVVLVITASGWVLYRFRQTRCLTLAEFFERRYSRRFRIFAGLVSFLGGLINFGIFPAVGARFFIYFCGLPQSFTLLGLELSTFPVAMVVLLATALFFVFAGGQIAVIVTDFVQGVFVNVACVAITVYLMLKVSWSRIVETLSGAPDNASLINPYKTSHVEDFNLWYHLIAIFGVVYVVLSWQGVQGYNVSARSAHEAKMGAMLSNWREVPRNLMLLFIPVVAYTVLRHADFAGAATSVESALSGVSSSAVQSQLRVPLVLVELLPVGLVGVFAALMISAFISTHDTYLHSWGSIFIQDVVMPLRREPLSAAQHLRLLRWSIGGVALFIFVFSLLFRQSEYILLFFAITGAIFTGGAGAVIIGGLYWRRGTTAAAWSALITGSTIAVSGIVVHRLADDFFINGQVFWGIAMGASIVVYVVVSLAGERVEFDLDALLHRHDRIGAAETTVVDPEPSRGFRILGMGREFTRGDRVIYIATYAWTGIWTLTFIAGTVYNLGRDVANAAWADFWRVYLHSQLAAAIVVIVWFTIGGCRDLLAMRRSLQSMERDPSDDGIVRGTQT